MLENDFEKYIKNNLESARWDWDKEEMWSDIEEHLPPVEKPKRVFGIWLWSGLILITATASFFVWSNKQDTDSTQAVVALEKTVDQEKIVDQENLIDQEKTIDQSQAQKSSNNNQEIKIPNQEINTNLESSKIVERSSSVKNNVSQTTTKSPENKPNGFDGKTIKTKKTVIGNDVRKGNEVVVSRSSQAESVTTKNNSSLFSKNDEVQKPKSSLEQMIDQHNQAYASNKQISVSKIDALFARLISSQDRTFKLTNKPVSNFIKPVDHSRLSALGIYLNYSAGNRYLAGSNTELLNTRQVSETVLEGIGAQLLYRHFWTKNLFSNIGIEYQRINEVLEFEEVTSTQEIREVQEAAYYVNFAGETKYISGERLVTEITKTPYRRYNEHHFISMPIHLGYSYNIDKISLNFFTGPVFNLYQSYKGDAINENLTLETNLQVGDFENSLLSGYDVGLLLDYNIGKSLSLSGGINYRQSISNFTIDNLTRQSYNSIDFKIGLLLKI